MPEHLWSEVQPMIESILPGWDYDLSAEAAAGMSDELAAWSVAYETTRRDRYPGSPRLMHRGVIDPLALTVQMQSVAA
jgi:hypothetical protein